VNRIATEKAETKLAIQVFDSAIYIYASIFHLYWFKYNLSIISIKLKNLGNQMGTLLRLTKIAHALLIT
ncbi:hypothetical protein J9303_21155, partial [Bacillaceae bacterium Marseille-Q3522]|nr:hypothetical protein [Bacillaceae bacterium Marseille-Q3522]